MRRDSNEKIVIFMIIMSIALCGTISYTVSNESWVKYTMADSNFSFHYPQGWKVDKVESAVLISNTKSNEQLIMTMIPPMIKTKPRQI